MSNVARSPQTPRLVSIDALDRRVRVRRALVNATEVIGATAMRVGDHADVWHFVQCASAWCRDVERELAEIDVDGVEADVALVRAGHRCAQRYPREVGEALCKILLAPGASTEMETWREVDRARESLVRVLDALLFNRRTF